MGNKKVIFLVGGPGSGKDLIINNILNSYNLAEFKIEQILSGKKERFLRESFVISTNAYNLEHIYRTKAFLEENGYDTAMIFVDVSDEISRQRSHHRDIPEDSRQQKLQEAKKNIKLFSALFETNFILYDNSNLLENFDQLKYIKLFTDIFLNLDHRIFENTKIKNKFSITKKLLDKGNKSSPLSPISVPSIGMRDFSTNDPGFPTPRGGIGSLGLENYNPDGDLDGSTLPANVGMREIPPTEIYKNSIPAIKKLAKSAWKQKR